MLKTIRSVKIYEIDRMLESVPDAAAVGQKLKALAQIKNRLPISRDREVKEFKGNSLMIRGKYYAYVDPKRV